MSLSIRRRLTLAFLALAALPLLVAVLANAVLYYRQHTAAELAHLRELATRVASQVRADLSRGEHALNGLLVYRDLMHAGEREQAQLLTELIARHGFLREVALIDDRGRERVRRSAHEVVLPETLRDMRGRALFVRAFSSGRTWYGPIGYDAGGEPLLELAVPVLDPYAGRAVAVLAAQQRLKPLWDLVAELDLGPAIQVYVLDETGAVVAHRNPSVVLRGTRIERTPTAGRGPGLAGDAFLAARTVQLGDRVLRVVAERAWFQAVAPAAVNLLVSGAVLLLALLLALAAGAYTLRRIVRPIVGVADTARAIAAGDLSQRVLIDSDDEIGDLTRSFNAMTDHLQQTLVTLKDEVGVRQQAEAALRESEARYRLLVENQNDLLVKVDPSDGCLLFVSPSYCRLFGRTQEELLGKPFLPLVHEGDRARVLASLAQLLEPPYTTAHEERALTVNGWRWLSWSNRAVVDTGGRVLEAIAVGRDITERKETELQLARYREQLEELVAQRTRELEQANAGLTQEIQQRKQVNDELEAFSYSVSHDLRAPLRSVMGFSQLLSRRLAEGLDEKSADYFERICNAAGRMNDLIDDLLRLSRLTRTELKVEAVDLSAIAREVLAELRNGNGERQVEARVADGLVVRADRRLMRIVLENLLSNAWKFTARRPRATIEVGTEERDGEAVVFVRDDGEGFDMSYAERLFGAFQRLHPESEFPGTGIGLATVQRIVFRHGGRVWAESRVGEGATFFIALPTERAPALTA